MVDETSSTSSGFQLFLDNKLPADVQAEAEEFMQSLLNAPSLAAYLHVIESMNMVQDGPVDEHCGGRWTFLAEDKNRRTRTRVSVVIDKRSSGCQYVTVQSGTVLLGEPDDYSTLHAEWKYINPRPTALAKVLLHLTR